MATLKISGLTKEQSNALAIAVEQNDDLLDFINHFNKYLKRIGVEEISEVQEVYFDTYNQGDNEIKL